MEPGSKAMASERLSRCSAPVRTETLQPWIQMLGAPLEAGAALQPSEVPPTPHEKQGPEKRVGLPGLRELMQGAPRELCCSLDGKLLVDPVRSPHGHVFERSNLIRVLT